MGSGDGIRQTRVRRTRLPRSTHLSARPGATTLAISTTGGVGVSLRPERIPVTSSDDDRRRVQSSYLRFTEVGIQYAATIVVLTLLGIWLDHRLGTGPLLTIVLLLVGFGGATWNLVRTVLGPDRPSNKPNKPDTKPDSKA